MGCEGEGGSFRAISRYEDLVPTSPGEKKGQGGRRRRGSSYPVRKRGYSDSRSR